MSTYYKSSLSYFDKLMLIFVFSFTLMVFVEHISIVFNCPEKSVF